MKLFKNQIKNQKGFSDVITITILAGVIGSVFIGGVFVWIEIDKFNAVNSLYSKLSKVINVEKEDIKLIDDTIKDEIIEYTNEKIAGTDLMKFESKNLGFSFEYPSDWNIAFRDNVIFISNFIYDTEGQIFRFPDEDSSVISIYSSKNEIPITSPQYAFLGGVIASKTIVETGEQQDIGPVPRILSNITVSTNHNNSYYSASLRPFDSKYKDVFEQIVSTFKFLDEVTVDTSELQGYNVYNLKNWNISISIPKDYKTSDDLNKEDASSYGFCKYGCILIKQTKENLEDFINSETPNEFSILISREVINISGIKATKFITSSDIGINYNHVYFSKGGKNYVISGQDFISEFDNIIESVRFN